MSAATLSAQRASIPAAGSTLEEHVSIPDAALRLTEDVVLLNGTMVHVRAIRADDSERLRAFHAQLSSESITYRSFRYVPELSRDEARRFTHIDYDRQMALVATQGTGDDERVLAVVRYCGLSAETAEVAFVVADAWQGHGIATLAPSTASWGRGGNSAPPCAMSQVWPACASVSCRRSDWQGA